MDAKEFSNHIDHLTAAGYTSLLLATGHELGLFETMMKENRPLTSQELADIAGMKERYVREWLAGVTTGKIVTLDTDKNTYYIPEHHHKSLKGPAAWAGGISACSMRKEDVKKCFLKDGPNGITYDHDEQLWSWFSDWRDTITEDFIEGAIVPNFKKSGTFNKLKSGINVLDAGCGSGELPIALARLFPKSTFTGLDFCEKPLACAKNRAASSNLVNFKLLQGDIHNLPDDLTLTFDMVTIFDVLHDLPDPHKALSQVHKVLKCGGILSIVDIAPKSKLADNIGDLEVAMFYAFSIFCCLPSSLSAEPGIGYGPCWGRQNIEAAIQKYFTIEKVCEISPKTFQFLCIKH